METVTLKEYFDARLEDLIQRIEQARVSMEKRLDGMNEFRDALENQSAKSPTREEMNSELSAIKKDLRDLNTFKDTLSGVASTKDVNAASMRAYISIGLSILFAILSYVLK